MTSKQAPELDDVQASRACEAALPLRLAEASVTSLSVRTLGNRPEQARPDPPS